MEKHYWKMIGDTQERVAKSLQIQVLDRESPLSLLRRFCRSYGYRAGEILHLPGGVHDGGVL